jgi:hypothetical protein
MILPISVSQVSKDYIRELSEPGSKCPFQMSELCVHNFNLDKIVTRRSWLKTTKRPGIVAHICNNSNQEAEEGKLSSRPG